MGVVCKKCKVLHHNLNSLRYNGTINKCCSLFCRGGSEVYVPCCIYTHFWSCIVILTRLGLMCMWDNVGKTMSRFEEECCTMTDIEIVPFLKEHNRPYNLLNKRDIPCNWKVVRKRYSTVFGRVPCIAATRNDSQNKCCIEGQSYLSRECDTLLRSLVINLLYIFLT